MSVHTCNSRAEGWRQEDPRAGQAASLVKLVTVIEEDTWLSASTYVHAYQDTHVHTHINKTKKIEIVKMMLAGFAGTYL